MLWLLTLAATNAAPLEFPNDLAEGCQRTQVEIVMVGDVMAHLSQVKAARNEAGDYDFTGQFAPVRRWIEHADLAIANLETVTAGADKGGYTGFRRFNTPDSLITALKGAGFDLLQTANNHCMDRDGAGLIRTLDVLEQHGLAHAGTHRSAEDKAQNGFARVELESGLLVAFLAYTYSTNGYWPPDDSPWMVNWTWKRHVIAADIARARASGAHLVIVGAHTGEEYTHTPEDWFIKLAGEMVTDGADVVMGTHPHVLQPALVRTLPRQGRPTDALILYSLGNFVSGQRQASRDGGVLATLTVSHCTDDPARNTLSAIRFTPVWVDDDRADNTRHYRVLPTPSSHDQPCTQDPDLSPADCVSLHRHREHVGHILGTENLSWTLPRAPEVAVQPVR